jgi:hypothetical protein
VEGRLSFMMQQPVSWRHLSVAAMLLVKAVCVCKVLAKSRALLGPVAINIRKNCVKFTTFILTVQVKTEEISGLVQFFPFAESWEME